MATRREPGGHSHGDGRRFVNSWSLPSTDDVGHVPKTLRREWKRNKGKKNKRKTKISSMRRDKARGKEQARSQTRTGRNGKRRASFRAPTRKVVQCRARKSSCRVPGSKETCS